MADGAVDIDQVIGRSTPDIDHKGPVVLLILGKNNLGAGKRTEHDILDADLQRLDTAERVVDARLDSVNNVKICLQQRSFRLEGIDEVLIPIDVIGLKNGVEKGIRCGNGNLLRVHLHGLQILGFDLPLAGKGQRAAVIEARQMRSRDRDPDVADFNIRLVLGIEDRLADALGDGLHIDDLPLAHAS